LLLELYDPW
jgi:hypothetical protein